jgi:helicase
VQPTTALDPDGSVSPAERVRALRMMVAAGLNGEAVTLTLIDGIGPRTARRLALAGVSDIESLAQAEPDDLDCVRGVSRVRAAHWIEAAARMVPAWSGWRYRESDAPLVPVAGAGWPEGIDPYRLRRALELRVDGGDEGTYRVTGGMEPHRVTRSAAGIACDCKDSASGQTCKHQLAVRLSLGDRALAGLVRQLRDGRGADGWDLPALWWGEGGFAERRLP